MKDSLYFATTNEGKVNSMRRYLEGYDVVQLPLHLEEPRTFDVENIAVSKVEQAYNHIRMPVFSIDAGFFVPSLNGFPGSFVNPILETIGLEGILKLVEDKSDEGRKAFFREALAFKYNNTVVTFVSDVYGSIVSPRGKLKDYHWSELSLIFVPEGESKTLAEMSKIEFDSWLENTSYVSVGVKLRDYLRKNYDIVFSQRRLL